MAGLIVGCEQRGDFAAQLLIRAALRVEKARPQLRRQRERGLKESPDAPLAFKLHRRLRL